MKLGKAAVNDMEYGLVGLDLAIILGNYKLIAGISVWPKQIAIGAAVDRSPGHYESGYVEYSAICDLFVIGVWAQLNRFY